MEPGRCGPHSIQQVLEDTGCACEKIGRGAVDHWPDPAGGAPPAVREPGAFSRDATDWIECPKRRRGSRTLALRISGESRLMALAARRAEGRQKQSALFFELLWQLQFPRDPQSANHEIADLDAPDPST